MGKILITAVAACILLSSANAGAAVDAGTKCQQSKLKARASLAKCLAKRASDVIAGKPDASPACREKFSGRIAKADAKATKAGTSCRFVGNLDGTVSDLDTGLMWEAKSGNDSIACPSGFYCLASWSRGEPTDENGPFSARDGWVTQVALTKLNAATSSDGNASSNCRGGHCDWRLPTMSELRTLVDLRYVDPNHETAAVNPVFSYTAPNYHWSSTVFAGNPILAWQIYMLDGSQQLARKVYWGSMKAVRSSF